MNKLPTWRLVLFLTLLLGTPLLLLLVGSGGTTGPSPQLTPAGVFLSGLVGFVAASAFRMWMGSQYKRLTWGRAADGSEIECPVLLRTDSEVLSPAARDFQARVRARLHPEIFERILHDGSDGLVLQGLRSPSPNQFLFVLCHSRFRSTRPCSWDA